MQQIGVDKYNSNLAVARNIWGIVDEYFRTHPELTKNLETTGTKFSEEILKKIPGLTTDEITHLQQTAAGEVSKGEAAVTGTAAQ